MKRRHHRELELKRIKKKTISFNVKELTAIEAYCQKYQVANKSKFMRETIITAVLKKFDDDYPTLWEDRQLKLFPNY